MNVTVYVSVFVLTCVCIWMSTVWAVKHFRVLYKYGIIIIIIIISIIRIPFTYAASEYVYVYRWNYKVNKKQTNEIFVHVY